MKIESITVKNFKVFKNLSIQNIPATAVFVGKNGVGKTTFFDIFGFLHDCLSGTVSTALQRRGGFNEVLSREQTGDIFFEIQFRPKPDEPKITYELSIGLNDQKRPVVKKETLRYRRGSSGAPWKVLDFSNGEGFAAEGNPETYDDVQGANRKPQKLASQDILAIKGLGQFSQFPAIAQFRQLIEDWYVSDFKIDYARERQEMLYSEQLSKSGDNLAAVTKFLYENHRTVFDKILSDMQSRVPGVTKVEADVTQDGYVVLRFQDGQFKNPFASKYVSDGTIKMFTYLVLLNNPLRHALLCIEEPENQLYPDLLPVLAEEFESYALNGGQVFISTHSPDFLNAIDFDSIFYLQKKNGFTEVIRASDNQLASNLIAAGDKPGSLWKQGLLTE